LLPRVPVYEKLKSTMMPPVWVSARFQYAARSLLLPKVSDLLPPAVVTAGLLLALVMSVPQLPLKPALAPSKLSWATTMLALALALKASRSEAAMMGSFS